MTDAAILSHHNRCPSLCRCMPLRIRMQCCAVLKAALESEGRLVQVLTLVEHAVLLYRALLPTPAWVRYFEGAGLGSVLTACYTGARPLPCSCTIAKPLLRAPGRSYWHSRVSPVFSGFSRNYGC